MIDAALMAALSGVTAGVAAHLRENSLSSLVMALLAATGVCWTLLLLATELAARSCEGLL